MDQECCDSDVDPTLSHDSPCARLSSWLWRLSETITLVSLCFAFFGTLTQKSPMRMTWPIHPYNTTTTGHHWQHIAGINCTTSHKGSWPTGIPAPVPTTNRPAVIPRVRSVDIIGTVSDPKLVRDSCGSTTFYDRTFWTCRDTQLVYANGSVRADPLIASSASWTDLDGNKQPVLQSVPGHKDPLSRIALQQYGKNTISQAFFPVLEPDFCAAPAGGCSDLTRFALWPDSPPMVTLSNPYLVIAYTWVRQMHINPDLSNIVDVPATILYCIKYRPGGEVARDSLPQVTVVEKDFWQEGEISFGSYGNVVQDGIAYLYGQAKGIVALAKVHTSQVENKAAYEYWVDGSWTKQVPSAGQDGINITNAGAGGQGTFYYSTTWHSYIWIGQWDSSVESKLFITTAPDPTGPWIEPFQFYRGIDGNYSLPAYTVQAHPGFSAQDEIYITYTKDDVIGPGLSIYTHPLVHVTWRISSSSDAILDTSGQLDVQSRFSVLNPPLEERIG